MTVTTRTSLVPADRVTRTTRTSLVASYRSVSPRSVAATTMDTGIANKQPSSTEENANNDNKKKVEPEDINPNATTRLRTAPVEAQAPAETKAPAAKKNEPATKNKAEPEDINPKAATRLRTAPVEAKDLVEAKAPAAAAAVASATETAVNTSIHQLVELLMMSTDAQVVVKGLCGLLEAVTDDNSDLLTIAIAGTNSAILYAMMIHADSPIVQAKGCSLISHLAVDARNQFAICQLHGLECILRAMDIHKEDFGVQKAALDGLGVLFSNNGDIQSIVKNDVVVAIGRALGNFSGDEKVAFQNKAFDVLSRMLP
jgi:hypothetical protein